MFHLSEVGEWLDTRFNRTRGTLDPGAFWSLYEHQGRALEAAPQALVEGPATELLVVLTTYRRPDACAHSIYALAQAVEEAQLSPATRVLVLNDRSEADYRATRTLARALFGTELVWLDARERLGKPGFWRAYQTAFLAARALAPRYALFLQDDLEFESSMLTDALASWQAIEQDPLRRVLYLFSSEDDERWGRWVWFRRRDVGHGLRLTQWFDLQAFLVDRAFFELLAYRMVPIHANRWRRLPWLSSGVGHQLTIRLRRQGNVYQAYPPLVFHGAQGSEMNPGPRSRRTLDNRRLAQKRA